MQRVSAMLSMRLSGFTLAQIGEAQTPTISPQAVHAAIKTALKDMIAEPLEQARRLELMRLDELLSGIYERAVGGDIPALDRVLALGVRRAKLLGLDMQTGGGIRFSDHGPMEFDADDPSTVRIEIVGDPEAARREHLLQKRIEALGGDPNIDGEDTPRRVN